MIARQAMRIAELEDKLDTAERLNESRKKIIDGHNECFHDIQEAIGWHGNIHSLADIIKNKIS